MKAQNDTIHTSYYKNGALKKLIIENKTKDRIMVNYSTWHENTAPDTTFYYSFRPQYYHWINRKKDSVCTIQSENGKHLFYGIYEKLDKYAALHLEMSWYEDGSPKKYSLNEQIVKEWNGDGNLIHERKYYLCPPYPVPEEWYYSPNDTQTCYLTNCSNSACSDSSGSKYYYADHVAYEGNLPNEYQNTLKKIEKASRKFKPKKYTYIPANPQKNIAAFYIKNKEVSNKEYQLFLNVFLKDSLCKDCISNWSYEDFLSDLIPDTSSNLQVNVDDKQLSLKEYFTSSEYEDEPVVGINWMVALYYLEWYNSYLKATIKDPNIFLNHRYRAPTLEEWNYVHNNLNSKTLKKVVGFDNSFHEFLYDAIPPSDSSDLIYYLERNTFDVNNPTYWNDWGFGKETGNNLKDKFIINIEEKYSNVGIRPVINIIDENVESDFQIYGKWTWEFFLELTEMNKSLE